jgi:hypothetical protein
MAAEAIPISDLSKTKKYLFSETTRPIGTKL